MNVEIDSPARATPHDALFKYIFSQPQHAASSLESVMPEALLQKLNLATLKLEPSTFVDARLSERRVDLLFSVRLKGRRGLPMYVLLEHQSTVSRLMVFRVQEYVARILGEKVRAKPGMRYLPVVLPVVIFNGGGRWSAPAEMHRLFDLPKEERAAFEEYLPKQRFVLGDLAALTPEELRRRGGTAEKCIAEALLARGRGARRLADIRPDLRELLLGLGQKPDGVYTFDAFVSYVREVTEVKDAEMRAVARRLGPQAEEAFMTAAEKLRREGRVEGRAETLLRQLVLRFGPLSDEVVARVRQGDLQALDRWTASILTAPTLEEALR